MAIKSFLTLLKVKVNQSVIKRSFPKYKSIVSEKSDKVNLCLPNM